MARKFAAAVFCLGAWHSASSLALGLGELTLDSFLNEPLKAKVDLLEIDGMHADEIRVRLATRDDFDRLGVERAYFLTSIKFEVQMDGSHRGQIILTSDDPVLEPYLDFIIEARWPAGRLLREYTVLVDPPVFKQSTTVISASDKVNAASSSSSASQREKKDSADVVSRSGTHVNTTRHATGAPMPQTAFNEGASAAPVAGARYMINRNDTLWEIAEQSRPQGVSVHQTMLDIQRLNPDAFIGGNINRIKAGYIIYLPEGSDISSKDVDSALEEINKQNQDWRAGRSSEGYSKGPSLRISADPDPTTGDAPTAAALASSGGANGAELAGLQDALELSERERVDAQSRLGEMEEQLETLRQIVNLKDEQIAALQGAIAEGGEISPAAMDDTLSEGVDQLAAAGEDAVAATEDDGTAAAEDDAAIAAISPETEAPEGDPDAAPVVEDKAEAPSRVVKIPSVTTPKKEPGFFESYWQYLAGGSVALVLLGVALARRKGDEDEEDEEDFSDEAYADIELDEQELEVEVETELDPALEVEIDDELAASGDIPDEDGRGYGEDAHDQYAADGAGNDVLGEADIYISYGRESQAIELLTNALASDPKNTDYRLKLLAIHSEAGDRGLALDQFNQLQLLEDATAIAKANGIMNKGAVAPPEPEDDEIPLDLELDDLQINGEEALEADFAGLTIEDDGGSASFGDELDLSEDFADEEGFEGEDDEEGLVFAAEGNEMSTKLDLARAYLDMGDEDGARQILEEVAADGSDDQRGEAEGLIQRLG